MPTSGLWGLAAAISAAYALAAAAPALRSLFPTARRWLGWLLLPVILGCTLIVPPDFVKLRALTAFLVNEVAMKVVDFFRQERAPSLRAYLWFLVPFPSLAIVFPTHKRRLARPDAAGPHLARLVLGTAGFVAGMMLTYALRDDAVLRSNFWLDHLGKIVLFLFTIESLSRALFALERLAGFDTTPVIQNAFLARTPAEFWRRYNRRVHDWLFRNVYQPVGRGRAPMRGVVMVFAFSALFHELMFGLATSHFDGRQLLFFLLQIPGVLASGPLERFARRAGPLGRAIAHAVTFAFMGATAVLFFRSLSRVFPFVYATPPPT